MMMEPNKADLESRIHCLLCGDLDDDQRVEALEAIAEHDEARRVLSQIVRVQRRSRQAFGYDGHSAAMRSSLANLKIQLHPPQAGPTACDRPRVVWPRSWPAKLAVWAACAAAVAIAVSAAIDARQDVAVANRTIAAIENRLWQLQGSAKLPELSMTQLAVYRRLWREIQQGEPNASPWALLQDGSGQFGYVPVADVPAELGSRQTIALLRCSIQTDQLQTLKQIDLLLPADRQLNLSMPGAGRIRRQPIHIDVSMENPWILIGVRVGEEPASAGVRGKIRTGDKATEIGRFRLDGSKLRVVVEAVRIQEDVSRPV